MLAELIVRALGDMPGETLTMAQKSDALSRRLLAARVDESKQLEERIKDIENDIAKLALFVRATIRTCMDKDLFTSQEFEAIFDAIDIEDGMANGRITPKAIADNCPSCGKRISRRKRRCFYCGYEVPRSKTMEDWGRK